MHPLDDRDIYLGLTDLSVGDLVFDLGNGVSLSSASAKFLSPLTLVCPPEAEPPKYPALPRPEFIQFATNEREVTAQLHIPKSIAKNFDERFAIGRFLILLLRLWSDPAIGFHVLATHNFNSIFELPDDDRPSLLPIETHQRFFHLQTQDRSSVINRISWVSENWESAYRLYSTSTEFRLAADTLDSAQFVPNPTLTLVSMWGALEAIFSPSTAELKFRVSALIASYLEPPGENRLNMQKSIGALYDMRSAAAHGKPKHQSDDLLKTHELLRKVIVRMIYAKEVPTKAFLESRLFGAL